jgi:hypothetical protein
MRVFEKKLAALRSVLLLAPLIVFGVGCGQGTAATYVDPLDPNTIKQIDALYRRLIEAENRHDLAEVRTMIWDSPSTLFVAKTANPAEGNWAGFWGIDVVLQHFSDLYSGIFVMDPDFSRVKTVGLTSDVAQTYAPLNITVGYAGQTPVPKPFLMIVNWIRTPSGWKMATDIALPIPPAPPQSK